MTLGDLLTTLSFGMAIIIVVGILSWLLSAGGERLERERRKRNGKS